MKLKSIIMKKILKIRLLVSVMLISIITLSCKQTGNTNQKEISNKKSKTYDTVYVKLDSIDERIEQIENAYKNFNNDKFEKFRKFIGEKTSTPLLNDEEKRREFEKFTKNGFDNLNNSDVLFIKKLIHDYIYFDKNKNQANHIINALGQDEKNRGILLRQGFDFDCFTKMDKDAHLFMMHNILEYLSYKGIKDRNDIGRFLEPVYSPLLEPENIIYKNNYDMIISMLPFTLLADDVLKDSIVIKGKTELIKNLLKGTNGMFYKDSYISYIDNLEGSFRVNTKREIEAVMLLCNNEIY